MARSTSEIDAIIAGLKTNRDTRDAYLEGKAAAFDDSNAVEAERIRSLKHTEQATKNIYLCVSCKAIKNSTGGVVGLRCNTYLIEDVSVPTRLIDGSEVAGLVDKGLKTLLVDESFTVTGATTVENL